MLEENSFGSSKSSLDAITEHVVSVCTDLEGCFQHLKT